MLLIGWHNFLYLVPRSPLSGLYCYFWFQYSACILGNTHHTGHYNIEYHVFLQTKSQFSKTKDLLFFFKSIYLFTACHFWISSVLYDAWHTVGTPWIFVEWINEEQLCKPSLTWVVTGYEELMSVVIDQPRHWMVMKGTALNQYLIPAWPSQSPLALEEINTKVQEAVEMSFYL